MHLIHITKMELLQVKLGQQLTMNLVLLHRTCTENLAFSPTIVMAVRQMLYSKLTPFYESYLYLHTELQL